MCYSAQRISDLVTQRFYHQGITVMYLTQNLFPPGNFNSFSFNSHYMIVFKTPRDSLDISTLARQMYTHTTNFLPQASQDKTLWLNVPK